MGCWGAWDGCEGVGMRVVALECERVRGLVVFCSISDCGVLAELGIASCSVLVYFDALLIRSLYSGMP